MRGGGWGGSNCSDAGPEGGKGEEVWFSAAAGAMEAAAFVGSVHTATLAVCTVLVIFVLVLGSLGNGMVLVSALRTRRLRSNFDLLILNLAGTDLVLCTALSPVFLYLLFSHPPDPKAFCGSFLFLGTLCGLLSLLTIVAIAIHRQARVVGHARGTLTPTQTAVILGAVWLLSLGVALGGTLHVFLGWQRSYSDCRVIVSSSDLKAHNYILFFISPIVVVSFVIIIVSYAIIARAVQTQTRSRGQVLPPVYKGPRIPATLTPAEKAGVISPIVKQSFGSGGAKSPEKQRSGTEARFWTFQKRSPTEKRSENGGEKRADSNSWGDKRLPPERRPLARRGGGGERRVRRLVGRQCPCCGGQAVVDKENKAVTMCLVVILTLLLCWAPLVVSQLVELFTGETIILYQVKVCGLALVFLNSALDPYIYAHHNGRMRLRYGRFFLDLMRCDVGRRASRGGRLRVLTAATAAGAALPRHNKLSLNDIDTHTLQLASPKQPKKQVPQPPHPGGPAANPADQKTHPSNALLLGGGGHGRGGEGGLSLKRSNQVGDLQSVMHDVRTFVHKSCCHAKNPEDLSLIES